MIAPGRGQSPEMVPFAVHRPRTFMQILCDGFTATNITSLDLLLAEIFRLRREFPGHQVVATLDDLQQACYTSGHGTAAHDLDSTAGHDLTGLDPKAFTDGEHLGYLSTTSEFPIRYSNLARLAAACALPDLQNKLFWDEQGADNDLVSINRLPDQALQLHLEEAVLFQLVPGADPGGPIAAFPNGYFASDLSPIENFALACHLHTEYGFRLFGIGSRFLGFDRDEGLSVEAATALSRDLISIYEDVPRQVLSELAQTLTGRQTVFIRYTES
ncbi:MAG: hypothetical protein J0M19_06585 [Sphingomonadales bacterium]|nr:hypothetical protein [Sphingomonadales bacterium]